MVCTSVTLAMDYKFHWEGNSIASVTLTRTVGSITLNTNGKDAHVKLTHGSTHH